MKKIIIAVLILSMSLSGCVVSGNFEDLPTASSTSVLKITATPSPIMNTSTSTVILMPTHTPAPTSTKASTPLPLEVKEITPVFGEKVIKLDVDRSYENCTIEPDIFVFDDEFIYYINETRIVRRNLKTNVASIIYDGVYDNKYLSIQDDWLYLYTQGTGIIKVKTDGSETQTIHDVQASRVMAADDDIYYIFAYNIFFDWQYCLYKYDTSENKNTFFRGGGINTKYQDENLYYTTYDGMKDDCWVYNTETESDEGHCCACYHLPVIVNDVVYHFYNEDCIAYDDFYLYTTNIKTGEQSIINIEGNNLVQYYNFLLFKDGNENLCAYNIENGILNKIAPFKDITLEAVCGDTIFVSKVLDSGITRIYSMDLTNGTEISKLFSYNRQYSMLPENKNLPFLSDIDVNKDYDHGNYLAVEFSQKDAIVYEDIEYTIQYEYDYNSRKTCYSLFDNTNNKSIIENISVVEDLQILIMIKDKIVYTNIDNPGYLYIYNISNSHTEILHTGMGVPIRYTPRFQYLIIDSYYKDFDYSFLFNEELDRYEENPVYTIALNMETGEIIEVVNDILIHPEDK